jgi:hypothetical protein
MIRNYLLTSIIKIKNVIARYVVNEINYIS